MCRSVWSGPRVCQRALHHGLLVARPLLRGLSLDDFVLWPFSCLKDSFSDDEEVYATVAPIANASVLLVLAEELLTIHLLISTTSIDLLWGLPKWIYCHVERVQALLEVGAMA